MADSSIEDLLARLERERIDADRRYNEALTAVDRAIQSLPQLPDVRHSTSTNSSALLAGVSATRAAPGVRGWLSRLFGSPVDAQAALNAVLVEEAARAAGEQADTRTALVTLVASVRAEFEALIRFQSLLVQYLQTITAYVDTKDRALGGSELRDRLALVEQRMMAIRRELERRPQAAVADGLPMATPSVETSVHASAYVGFEDRFRGARDEIRGRVSDYLSILSPASDVVDVGCGRGELLELLKERGTPARGVDGNEAMAAECQSRGLQVEHGDALTYLERQAPGSIGALVAIQVVEHFEPNYLARVLDTAYERMRPGAPLILETLNPACWMAFFECYIRDLTHQRPLHPDTLRYLVEASGFSQVDVQFRQPVREVDRLDRVSAAGAVAGPVAELAAAINAHADKLNARLFSSMDYAVVARR